MGAQQPNADAQEPAIIDGGEDLDDERPSPRPLGDDAPCSALFDGVFLGGFECSCHLLEGGRRLDLLEATHHYELASEDFARLRALGMTACRDGAPWPTVERRSGQYDFSRVATIAQAAASQGVQVIWDLMHFGWPDDLDVFGAELPKRFGRYAHAFAAWLAETSDAPAMFAPVNEMSFLAWAGGDVAFMNPFAAARGVELKVQLVRCTLEAIDAIRSVLPNARFLQPEPVINIVPDPGHPKTWRRVESDNLLQYQAWDMLVGGVWPQLGGHSRYLDLIGVNFYSDNQFTLDGTTIERGDSRYKSFASILLEVWRRYRRPMIVSETGAEGDARAGWIRYVCEESARAMQQGCELHGVTLYPVLDHPGWVDERHCQNGLWGYPDERGQRAICASLADELHLQAFRLKRARADMLRARAGGAAGAEGPGHRV